MILDLIKLKEGVPESVTETLDPKTLDVEYVDLHYKTPVVVTGTAEKILNTVTFHGNVTRTVEHVCARCLTTTDESLSEPLDLTFEIQGLTEIDLLSDVRDVLILSHPEKFVCQPDCKGLCPHCGANLNTSSCSCKSKSVSSKPFSKLNQWFKKKSEGE